MARSHQVERVVAWFPRHAGAVLAATLVLTALAVAALVDLRTGRPRLEMDASAETLLPADDAERRFFERVQEIFGRDETMIVAVAGADAFSDASLARVEAMTRRLAALEGVDRVLSLTTAVGVRAEGGDVWIGPLVDEPPADETERGTLRRRVLDDPLYGGSLVSSDGRVSAIVVYFLPMSTREFAERGLDAAIGAIAAEEGGDGEVWITGGPHIREATARMMLGESVGLTLGILGALAGVLVLAFRSARGVVLPLATIVVAVLWTLGGVAALGVSLNAVTTLIPPLLTALGLSYTVHVVSEWTDVRREDAAHEPPEPPAGLDPHRDRVGRATARVALPVLLTGLTTAAGLASLTASTLPAVREFGAIAVAGVLATMTASLTFTPAVLAVLGAPRRPPRPPRPLRGGGHGLDGERLLERVGRFAVRRRAWVFAGTGLLVLVSLAGAARLRIGTEEIGKFPAESRVRRDFEAVNAHLGGANPLYVVLTAEEPDAFLEPANLRAVETLQAWLAAQPEVGATASLADFVKRIHQGFRGGAAEAYAIPETRRGVRQLLFLAGGPELDRFVDADYATASIHARARVVDSEAVGALVARIEARLAELPRALEGRVTGTSVVLTGALDDVVRSQTRSLLAALVVIYAILAALFVSFRVGALALVPNAVPVVAFFGAMGLSGTRLGPATSLVAPMVLGIAVDDTIHFFARFVNEARRTADESRAAVAALEAVGRPVTITSAALCAGFLVLLASDFESQRDLGAMAAVALFVAWGTDLVLTPALCAGLRVATLWDLLALDLGPEPHRAIRLLHGLRAGQARVVALLARVVEVPAGDRLFARGEPGDAVYAVIDGRLRVSVERDGARRELQRLGRGDVVGEIGLLHLERSADVDALSDARLLRLTERSLAQLGRRYPRIAAVLYQNLSGLAAERLAQVTPGGGPVAGPAPHRGPAGEALARAFYPADAAALRRAFAEAAPDPRDEVAGLLARAGVAADVRAALELVPLVCVAWADGRLDRGEDEAVLAAAERLGVAAPGAGRELLARWLEREPDAALWRRWRAAVAEACGELSLEARMRLADGIGARARGVAEAAGGFLGMASVSRREEEVLADVERVFAVCGPFRGPGA